MRWGWFSWDAPSPKYHELTMRAAEGNAPDSVLFGGGQRGSASAARSGNAPPPTNSSSHF